MYSAGLHQELKLFECLDQHTVHSHLHTHTHTHTHTHNIYADTNPRLTQVLRLKLLKGTQRRSSTITSYRKKVGLDFWTPDPYSWTWTEHITASNAVVFVCWTDSNCAWNGR